ncbi:MAG: acyl--CoA ligase [Gammaproteobacteria bacterium]|nr:acyl--CoA ligase [Gammaproteobacteria bacterium]
MNLVMVLEMAAECHRERTAVSSGSGRLSYGELLEAAQTAAADIRASGCRYVAVLDINSLAVPIAVFAAAYAGLPYVPLNYRLTRPELAELLARIDPAYLIGEETKLRSFAVPSTTRIVDRAHFLELARRPPAESAQASGDADDIAIQLFTSGTTGKPKAAVLRHENLMSYILGTVEFGAAAEDDAVLISVPPYHIAGISAVLSSTYACRRMVQLPNFDAAGWLAHCRTEGVSNAFLVPTMLSRIVDHLEATGTAPELPQLRAIAYGGGKMPHSVIERAMQLLPGVDFTNAYGLTETSSTICLLDPGDHRAAAESTDPLVRRRLGSVGRPINGIELEIRDDDGHVLGPDQTGDVYVRGAQVSGEYLGAGSTLVAGGWFPTRDRGHLDAGGYLYLEGRADDVIVRGGENISPGEIEDVLAEHPAVADVAVVAIPDEQWGEAVGAAVVLKDSAQATAEALQDWVKQRLRSSRVPAAIQFRDDLPYNEMGKLLRRVIKQELQDGQAATKTRTR